LTQTANHKCISRKQCDEARPECEACVRRGVKCSGYQRALAFKDVSDQTAELSRRFEAARWAALREEDLQRQKSSTRDISQHGDEVDGDDDDDGDDEGGGGKGLRRGGISMSTTAAATEPTPKPMCNFVFETGGGNMTARGGGGRRRGGGKKRGGNDEVGGIQDSITVSPWILKTTGEFGSSRENSNGSEAMSVDGDEFESSASPDEGGMIGDGSSSDGGKQSTAGYGASLGDDHVFDMEGVRMSGSGETLAEPEPPSVIFSNMENDAKSTGRRFSVTSTGYLADDGDTISIMTDDMSLAGSSWGGDHGTPDAGMQMWRPIDGRSLMNDPVMEGLLTSSPDASLFSHFENTVVNYFPVPFSFRHQYSSNDCFRMAILAMSSANLSNLQRNAPGSSPRNEVATYGEPVTRAYYASAVRELYNQITQSNLQEREPLAAAALVLAYYEMETGTPNGTMNHARGVDAILSRLDMTNFSLPEVFKAWRFLHYDTRFMLIPTRKSSVVHDPYALYSMMDPQLAIREIYLNLNQICGRYTMEACFPVRAGDDAAGAASPAEQAARWLAEDSLRRKCDRRSYENRDFHETALSREEIMEACDRYANWLDQWHAALDPGGLPILKLKDDNAFINGDNFDPILPVAFADHKRGFDYLMYVSSRLFCNYLRSIFDPVNHTAAITESWAKLILGIGLGLHKAPEVFTCVQPSSMLYNAAMLTEGTGILDAYIDGLLPRMRGTEGGAKEEEMGWRMYMAQLGLIRREKIRGRALRYVINGFDDDFERNQMGRGHSFAAFGDYNGKGTFRTCYFVEY
jgi:hypothetical protein